jgi:DNA-directed RNA polymerase specialized sigma24 family protein
MSLKLIITVTASSAVKGFDPNKEAPMVSVLLPEILRLRRAEHVEDVVDPTVDVADEACAAIAAACVREYLDELPERERTVIASRFGLGGVPQSHHTIARDLDLAVGTIWTIERRALTMLRTLDCGGSLPKVA